MPPMNTKILKINLIFNNQLQKLHLPSKNFNKKCSNCGICEESVPGF